MTDDQTPVPKNNFKLKLNLATLVHQITEIEGKKCIIIPIEENDLYEGEKGALYLSLIGREASGLRYDKTHIVKQSFSKEFYHNMSEEARADIPIFGDMQPSNY